jgi:phage shock protein B
MDLTAIIIVGIVFGSVVILTAIFVSASMASKMLGARGTNRLSEEESQLMQELFYGMKKMEDRVESLETILLEKGNNS